MIWKLHHQNSKKYTKCLNIERFIFKNHLEFFDNKHKCMKVVDALGQIYWYTTMCHLFKGFLPKFQIFKFQDLSWNTIAY
jgi:hypothetical protein